MLYLVELRKWLSLTRLLIHLLCSFTQEEKTLRSHPTSPYRLRYISQHNIPFWNTKFANWITLIFPFIRIMIHSFIYLLLDCDGLIVPQEVVSASHSAIYPNVPVVKKGTDSRFGFGFRLGEHSDFQFLFELGPQKYTKPIGKINMSFLLLKIPQLMFIIGFLISGKGPSDDDSFASKRMVDQSDFRQTVKVRRRFLNHSQF